MNDKKINILFVLPNLGLNNGVVTFAINYYRKIDKSRFHIDFAILYASDTKYCKELRENGSEIFVLPDARDYKNHFKSCIKILKNKKYDIIHNCCMINSIPIMIVGLLFGVKHRILHIHSTVLGNNTYTSKRNAKYYPLLKLLATDYAACSYHAASILLKDKNYKVIPNIINDTFTYSEKFRNEIREKYNIGNKFLIISVARPTYFKNPIFCMDIINYLLSINNNIEYWWIGDGDMFGSLKKYVEDKNLSEKVKLLGNIDNIEKYYSAADCVIMPSINEGLGYTILEAQSEGLKCFASDNIPKEAKCTDLVNFIPLEIGAEKWAEQISNYIDGYSVNYEKRIKYNNEFRESIFFDKNAGNFIEEYYRNLLNRKH